MTAFLSNVFNDPSSPWYYILGVLFLAIIFGALAVYIVWDSKRKKSKDAEAKPEKDGQINTTEQTVSPSEDAATETTEPLADTATDENKE